MRRSLPYDAAICLCLAVLIAMGVGRLAEKFSEGNYERQKQKRAPAIGEVGGQAGEEIFRAQTVEDMLNHDLFTIECPNYNFYNDGTGYYQVSGYNVLGLTVLTLPSKERVAAQINSQSIQYIGGDFLHGGGDMIFPVGRIVYEDLASSESFLKQIEHGGSLSRRDFYVDMSGNAVMTSKQDTVDTTGTLAQIITVMILYPIFHALGSKFGLWNPYFRRRNQSEWK